MVKVTESEKPKGINTIVKIYAFPGVILILTFVLSIIECILNIRSIKHYWEIYIVLAGIFAYIFYSWKTSEMEQRKRRLYFTIVFAAILYIVPHISSIHIIQKGLWSTSVEFTTVLIVLLAALVIYIFIVSDANITEISVGNNKVSLVKKEYAAEIAVHQNISDLLAHKINAENELVKNMTGYLLGSIGKMDQKGYCFENEFQSILNQYYSLYREYNDIIVSVYDAKDIEELKDEFELNKGELYKVKQNNENDEVTILVKNSKYLLIKSYKYFEEDTDASEAIVVLQSQTSYISEVEAAQINIILSIFLNQLILLADIAKKLSK